MNTVIYQNVIFGVLLVITPWKLVGYAGITLFAGRWFVQVIASKIHGHPVLPRVFWYMSISGSLLLLCYFSFGRLDSVGILSNLFPMTVSIYNLWLDLRNSGRHKRLQPAPPQARHP